MSNFQNNPYDLNDFHSQQARHYGIKISGALDDNRHSKRSAAPQSPHHSRRPDLGTSAPTQSSAYPTIQRTPQQTMQRAAPTIQRKPVRTHAPATDRPLPPLPADASPSPARTGAEPSRSNSTRSQKMNVIFTTRDGKFDSNNVKQVSRSTFTPPASPLQEQFSRRPGSSSSTHSSGKGKSDLKRTDSRSSIKSLTDGVKTAVRRGSKWMEQKQDIMRMSARDREGWVKQQTRSPSDERESRRRADPFSRPSFQRDYLVEKNKLVSNGGIACREMTGQNFEAMVEQSRSNDKINRALGNHHSPDRLPVGDLTLSPAERAAARESASAYHYDACVNEVNEFKGVPRGRLTKGEKAAVLVSRIADPLKRKGTANSDESFGCVGACARCGRPTGGAGYVMVDGYCQSCALYRSRGR